MERRSTPTSLCGVRCAADAAVARADLRASCMRRVRQRRRMSLSPATLSTMHRGGTMPIGRRSARGRLRAHADATGDGPARRVRAARRQSHRRELPLGRHEPAPGACAVDEATANACRAAAVADAQYFDAQIGAGADLSIGSGIAGDARRDAVDIRRRRRQRRRLRRASLCGLLLRLASEQTSYRNASCAARALFAPGAAALGCRHARIPACCRPAPAALCWRSRRRPRAGAGAPMRHVRAARRSSPTANATKIGASEQPAARRRLGQPPAPHAPLSRRLRAHPAGPGVRDDHGDRCARRQPPGRRLSLDRHVRRRSATPIMDRLDAIVQPAAGRHLVPVDARTPRQRRTRDDLDRPPRVDGEYYPQHHASVRTPVGAARGADAGATASRPSRTVFGLRTHFGCWWVQLYGACAMDRWSPGDRHGFVTLRRPTPCGRPHGVSCRAPGTACRRAQ